jgi:hypothetical protein
VARAERAAIAVAGAVPAEVTVEVFRGGPIEPAHPDFEAAIVIVDVLDVVDALDAFASTRIERHMRELGFAGEGAISLREPFSEYRKWFYRPRRCRREPSVSKP